MIEYDPSKFTRMAIVKRMSTTNWRKSGTYFASGNTKWLSILKILSVAQENKHILKNIEHLLTTK